MIIAKKEILWRVIGLFVSAWKWTISPYVWRWSTTQQEQWKKSSKSLERVRIAEAQKDLGLDAKEAEQHILHLDSQRLKWVHYLYHTDWDDPFSYDLVSNLDKLDVGEASELVIQTARLASSAWTGERKQRVSDLALATQVKEIGQ